MGDPDKFDVYSHPLASAGIGGLIIKYGLPSIVAMLVGALYNIVDQIFIGHKVGMFGNAATNVAFPLGAVCMSIALLLGVGGASNFNLEMGRGNRENAGRIAANAVTFMGLFGLAVFILVRLFLVLILEAFGATPEVMPYALTYTSIISLGIPFMIMSIGCTHLIRADGSPRYSMICNVTGAVMNVILNSVLMFGLDMGIAGAAWGTVISQFISWLMAVRYISGYKSAPLVKNYFIPRLSKLAKIASLGAAASFNQLSMMCVQVTLNNVLTHYGALSAYGANIPLAASGIITKVNMVFISVVVGLAQGGQPIIGFNYGARNYARVKRTFRILISVSTGLSFVVFVCFQLFPTGIISLFGSGSGEYYRFVERYFRIFLFMTVANGVQPLTSNFFTSIGKATRGIFISLTRQIIFLLPLVIIFPRFWGVDGVMYAGPAADAAAVCVAAVFLFREFREMRVLEEGQTARKR
ncbi:MAG: MATE family efflux transporter [Synergistaceae bacterium]|nr:MATE family efflux transporter [Synergistaceae bacterium]